MKNLPVFVYAESITSRLSYVMEVLLGGLLQLEYELTNNKADYLNYAGAKINYSQKRLSKQEIFIPSGTLLFEKDIKPLDMKVERKEGLAYFFRLKKEEADFDFDLPAMCFYLLSRYEEYLPFEADEHGRFTAKSSLAYQHDFLQEPIINQWAERLRQLLNEKFEDLNIAKPRYQFQPTYDVDAAWAFLNKGFRFWGGMAKDLIQRNWEMISLRQKVKSGKQADPFYSFDLLRQLHQKYNLKPIWFFLLGDYGKFDKNIHWRNKELRKFIAHIEAFDSNVGIHPSYASNGNIPQLKKEIARLYSIVNRRIKKSRQHYLKLSFPDTYRNLIQTEIECDYTLGYADAIGFRAGIAASFPWYDLQKEATTTLILHPFQVMDVTLKNYLQLSPEDALNQTKQLISIIKSVGGTFTTLWHNSSFSEAHAWEGWREMYEGVLKSAAQI